MTCAAPEFVIEPINRFLHADAIQAFMDRLSDELFPGNWPKVPLKEIPFTDEDVWLGIYKESGWLAGLVYALKIPGIPGHNLHLIFEKGLRGRALLPVLEEAATELFDTHGVALLCAVIPARWRHARWLAAAFGFKPDAAGLWFLGAQDFHLRYPD